MSLGDSSSWPVRQLQDADQQWVYTLRACRPAGQEPEGGYDELWLVGATEASWGALQRRLAQYGACSGVHPAFVDASEAGWRVEVVEVEKGPKGLEELRTSEALDRFADSARVRVLGGARAALPRSTLSGFYRTLSCSRRGACYACGETGHYAGEPACKGGTEQQERALAAGERADEAEARADEAEARAKKAEKRAKKEEARAAKEKRSAEEAQKKAVEAEQRAVDATSRAEALCKALQGAVPGLEAHTAALKQALASGAAPLTWEDRVKAGPSGLSWPSTSKDGPHENRFRVKVCTHTVNFPFTKRSEPSDGRCQGNQSGKPCRNKGRTKVVCGVQACAFAEAEQCARAGHAAEVSASGKQLRAWKEEYGVDVAAPKEPPALPPSKRPKKG